MAWRERANQAVEDALGGSARAGWAPQLGVIAGLPKGSRVLKRLHTSRDVEDLKDVLAEVRIGLCLVGQGFEVSIEPHGEAGPDLGAVRGGIDAVVEVCRLRSVYEDLDIEELERHPDMLPPMGDTQRDLRRMRAKIIGKFRQLDCSEPSILAVWNDQDCMIEGEAKTVVHQIAVDASHDGVPPPQNMEFVVYGSPWVSCRNQQQFYTYSHQMTTSECMVAWRHEWEASRVGELVRDALRLALPPSAPV